MTTQAFYDMDDDTQSYLVARVKSDLVQEFNDRPELTEVVMGTLAEGGLIRWSIKRSSDFTTSTVESMLANMVDKGDYLSVDVRQDPVYYHI